MSRFVWSSLFSAAVVAASVLAATGAAAAQDVGGARELGPYLITTFAGKCLDVSGASTADKAQIIQYTCKSSGGSNQQFTLNEVGDGNYQIRTFAGKCLDVSGASSADKAQIIQYTCKSSGGSNQQFSLAYP